MLTFLLTRKLVMLVTQLQPWTFVTRPQKNPPQRIPQFVCLNSLSAYTGASLEHGAITALPQCKTDGAVLSHCAVAHFKDLPQRPQRVPGQNPATVS